MQQTIINGYQVIIFTGYHGTQLFINNPNGDTIYAHKVSGGETGAMQRAREVIAQDAPAPVAAAAAPQTADKMICLSNRRQEFTEALNRGKDNRFDVFADWDKDSFVVVNLDNQTEYRVKLETRNNFLHACCECPDFQYKKRICKHIGEVLTNALFSVAVKN